jgi:PAS domain S-box-containing protein
MIVNNVTELKHTQASITCLNEKLEEKIFSQTAELTASNLRLQKNIEELSISKHQLMEREVKYNSIYNASVEGIITVGINNSIVSANAAVETIFGYKPEELKGCNIKKIMPLLSGLIEDGSENQTLTERGKIQEVEGLHKNGAVVFLDLSLVAFSIDSARYFTHIVRDVSSRKMLEQQDRQHLDQLAHVTRLGLMGEMASGIAHEVNQPLAAISNYTQASINLIKKQKPDFDKLADILSKTQQQALRAGQIIHRMRSFVKSHTLQRSTVDLSVVIQDAVDLCMPELKQNNITLALELENNLPSVYVDKIQIEQVLINLIRNSVDAMLKQSSSQDHRLAIYTSLTPNNDIQVRVKDNGHGIDSDQQQKILTPFYTTKKDGMGMGLSISRSLIEAHQGSLYFNSKPEKGTTFYFTLPLRKQYDER